MIFDTVIVSYWDFYTTSGISFLRKTEIAQFTFKQYVPKEKARYNKYDRNLNPYVQINVKIIFKKLTEGSIKTQK